MTPEKKIIKEIMKNVHTEVKSEIFGRRCIYDANGIGEAGTLFPTTHQDDCVAWFYVAHTFAIGYSKLYTSIYILQPILGWGCCKWLKQLFH